MDAGDGVPRHSPIPRVAPQDLPWEYGSFLGVFTSEISIGQDGGDGEEEYTRARKECEERWGEREE